MSRIVRLSGAVQLYLVRAVNYTFQQDKWSDVCSVLQLLQWLCWLTWSQYGTEHSCSATFVITTSKHDRQVNPDLKLW